MAPTRLTRRRGRTRPWLRKKAANIPLRKHDVSLPLEIPDYGLSPRFSKDGALKNDPDGRLASSSAVLLAHIEFKAEMHPDQKVSRSFTRRCKAEVDTIGLFFPGVLSVEIRVCFSAWLAFACAMDDILETLPPREGEAVLYECIGILQGGRPTSGPQGNVSDTRVQHLARTLRKHCARYLAKSTCLVFFREVCAVFYAHIDEIYFLSGRIPNDLPTYMTIRSRTISLNPFFEVIKWEYLPPEWRLSGTWEKLQHEVSSAAGLQNDLIGLERDLDAGEQLNSVVVLMGNSSEHTPDGEDDEALLSQCVGIAVAEHNKSVAQVLARVAKIHRESRRPLPDSVADVLRHIVLLCETHLKWVTSAKRYRVMSE